MKKRLWIILLLLILAAAGAAASLTIDEVYIQGNDWYTDEEAEALVFPTPLSRRTVYAWIADKTGKKENIPFIEDYEVLIDSPHSAEVIVYEKSIVGYVYYMSSYMFFDKDGIVVESSNTGLDGIPLITGLDFGSIVLYRQLPVKDERVFGDILNLTQLLSTHQIPIDRINYSSLREATLYRGDLEVKLGSNEDMSEKIMELKDMLPKLEGMAGTLYLDSYDKNNTNAAYTFKRKQKL